MKPEYLLITPPVSDPTSPYHSLAYLVGHAKSQGFERGEALDLNISIFDELAKPDQVQRLLDHAAQLRSKRQQGVQTRLQSMREAIAHESIGLEPDAIQKAIAVLQHERDFYDFDLYSEAVELLERWQRLLSIEGFPGQFKNFSLDTSLGANFNSSHDMANPAFLSLVNAPFNAGYAEVLDKRLHMKSFDLIGVSINYISQLPFGLEVLRRCKAIQPNATLIAGGTDVSDIVKYAENMSAVWRIFGMCDAIVAGEGETALVSILQSIENGAPIESAPGIAVRGQLQKPTYRNENLRSLGSPDYSIYDLQSYWSPSPVFLYSPTRGCYWNKCTFCDYGLNFDMPTSPSREINIDRLIADLRQISSTTPFVYFAVDAISPSFLRRMCSAIEKSGVDVRWSAELRLEPKISDPDLASMLKNAGCVAISFGLESASQRILDLINKGVQVENIPSVLTALKDVDIGAQMMAFTGFPGETEYEAKATFDFLREYQNNWALAMVGEFGLTQGAIVAKSPELFGVSRVFAAAGDDIPRQMLWENDLGATRDRDGVLGLARPSLPDDLQVTPLDRPWVGGIDAAHSILYFFRNGSSLIDKKESQQARQHHSGNAGMPERVRQCFETLKSARRKFISSPRSSQGYSRSFNEAMEWYESMAEYTEQLDEELYS